MLPASWPAIVDTETFNQVQERLKTNRSRYKPEEWKTYAYPLTEKVVCGECGKLMGGKSAHGRNGKHHYYEHGRKPKSDGVHHLRRCRLERLRAERIEGMVLGALKATLSDPAKLDDAIRAHSKAKTTEIPGIEGRLSALTSDIRTNEKRVEALISRLSDLPADVPPTRSMRASRISTRSSPSNAEQSPDSKLSIPKINPRRSTTRD